MKMRIAVICMSMLCIAPMVLAQHSQVFYQDSVLCDTWHTNDLDPLPPLEVNMPFDVMVGYIVADTLCRVYDAYQIDSLVETISADSIEIAMKTFIAIKN